MKSRKKKEQTNLPMSSFVGTKRRGAKSQSRFFDLLVFIADVDANIHKYDHKEEQWNTKSSAN